MGSTEEQARHVKAALGSSPRGLRQRWALPIALVILLSLCVVLSLVVRDSTPPGAKTTGNFQGEANVQLPSTLIRSAPGAAVYYFSWGFDGEPNDIYFVTAGISPTAPTRVTFTDDYSELWPAPSPIDGRLAYFLVSPKDERSLRVMNSEGANVDVTYYVGSSELRNQFFIDLFTPPQWSSYGDWIAFQGRTAADKPLSIELFVADVQHSTVYRLTYGGGVVTSFNWDSPTDLVYTQQGNDGSLTISKVSVNGLPQPVTPVPIGSLPQK